MKIKILRPLLLSLLIPFASIAQEKMNAPAWRETPKELIIQSGKRNIIPNEYKVFYQNTADLRSALIGLSNDYKEGKIFQLPTPDGSTMDFRIWQTPMMEPQLAAKYPEIKTFTAEAVTNHNITAKIEISPAGFNAYIFNGDNSYLIDPYADVDNGYSLCYFKRDAAKLVSPTCLVKQDAANGDEITLNTGGKTAHKTFGTQRRTYRLALACTYEYAVAVAGASPTKANVLAQMVLIINRVNGVYERDLASTMVLVGNTDTLICLSATEPYTNDDGEAMLAQNQTAVDTKIGTANYDIGHVFSTGGGGIAYINALCTASTKAGGVTGLPNPVGDAFAIDFVAHEIGHEFGSDHTFNSNKGNCQGNYNTSTAFEPGSGSTIMAYAGICNSDDLQPNSDAYFHVSSLKEIITHITTATCGVTTTTPNVPNAYPDFTRTYNIPNWTPFELTAPTVTDATADTLTYCWEEWDLGGPGKSWNANNNVMPYFRSFTPSFSPTRVFPVINKVMAGISSSIGERLPAAARTLKFVLTTRDIYQGYGDINASYDTDTITLISSAITGATDTFKVTSQGTATTWAQGSTQTVTWNVGTTTASPISASRVNIYLSTDSAQTFPYVLASNVPNNGSAVVTIPTGLTANNKSRVKVKGFDNVFFQLNKANITIPNAPLALTLTSFDAKKDGCGVDLHWSLVNDGTLASVIVERSDDGKNYKAMASIPAQQDPSYVYNDKSLKNGTYQYRLAIVKKDGTTASGNTVAINVNCNVSGNTMLFPNPAKGILNVESTENVSMLKVYTATGQLVKTKNYNPATSVALDVNEFAAGVYMLQVITENGDKQNLKFVKE